MSTLNWSSPVRQSKGQTLSPIPNEIYHEIFSYIRPLPTEDLNDNPLIKSDLCNLALVCRFFSATVLPWIFESVCFDSRYGGTSSPPSHSESPFCRSILKGSRTARAMAQYVKKCEFLSWKVDDQNEWICTEFMALYVDTLAYMPNIQELTLTHTTITKGLLKAIGDLRNLSTLNVISCHLAANVKRKHMKNLSLLKLKFFRFIPTADDALDMVRSINLDSLLHLTIKGSCVSSFFTRSRNVLPLEKLDIFALDGPSELEALLLRAPALKTLHIEYYDHDALDLSKIKQNLGTLPLLETIEGPLSLVKYMLYKRPISFITILNSKEGVISILPHDVEDLLKSSRPITHLGVPVYVGGSTPFWTRFPDLQSLELKVCFGQNQRIMGLNLIIMAMTGEWPVLPGLQTLAICIDWLRQSKHLFTLPIQHRCILEFLVPHFPAMRRCSFIDYIQWSYEESSAEWIPEIAPRHYLDLDSDALMSMSLDDGGCLERILSFRNSLAPADYDRICSKRSRREPGLHAK